MVTPRNELLFVPLGGSGEIGMNLNLYGHDGRWIMLDCGIGFTRGRRKTKVVMPDPEFIAAKAKSLDALVITHAHLDHLGAVADMWPRLRCPVYATPVRRGRADPQAAGRGAAGRRPVP